MGCPFVAGFPFANFFLSFRCSPCLIRSRLVCRFLFLPWLYHLLSLPLFLVGLPLVPDLRLPVHEQPRFALWADRAHVREALDAMALELLRRDEAATTRGEDPNLLEVLLRMRGLDVLQEGPGDPVDVITEWADVGGRRVDLARVPLQLLVVAKLLVAELAFEQRSSGFHHRLRLRRLDTGDVALVPRLPLSARCAPCSI